MRVQKGMIGLSCCRVEIEAEVFKSSGNLLVCGALKIGDIHRCLCMLRLTLLISDNRIKINGNIYAGIRKVFPDGPFGEMDGIFEA